MGLADLLRDLSNRLSAGHAASHQLLNTLHRLLLLLVGECR